eukprot:scaffold4364_cov119-Isochrysis_galbana.AAC.2
MSGSGSPSGSPSAMVPNSRARSGMPSWATNTQANKDTASIMAVLAPAPGEAGVGIIAERRPRALAPGLCTQIHRPIGVQSGNPEGGVACPSAIRLFDFRRQRRGTPTIALLFTASSGFSCLLFKMSKGRAGH